MKTDFSFSHPTTGTSIEEQIKRLALAPHPEGGYFRRIYTSPVSVQTKTGTRPAATIIYYLLPENTFSCWHRLANEEVWIFDQGLSLTIHQISPDGLLTSRALGSQSSEASEIVIPAKHWFAAEPQPIQAETYSNTALQYALVRCLVAPGFDFDDFELGDQNKLEQLFPTYTELIRRLSRPLLKVPVNTP